jgi:hypothetical protein
MRLRRHGEQPQAGQWEAQVFRALRMKGGLSPVHLSKEVSAICYLQKSRQR